MTKSEIKHIKYAALCLTHNCNLRCKYCYAGEKVNKRMDFETARKAVDFLHQNSNGKCIVTFFGGEPLLEMKLIKEVVKYSRNKYENQIEYRMSTNGTLLTKENIEFLRNNDIYFVLSIDGHKAQHDSCRSYANDKGSFDHIVEKLPDIFDFNPYTIAVSVIVPETVQYLAEGVKDLFSRGFRYVLQSLDYSTNWQTEDIKALKEQYKALSKYYYKALASGKNIYYSPFDERIKTHAQKLYCQGDLCDLANTQLAIAPSGRIYPCVQFIGDDNDEFQTNAIGDVFDGFNDDRRTYYIEQNYAEKESCNDCALDGRCATFCGCVNWKATGSLNKVPPIICEHERMMMPIVDKMANKLWKKHIILFKRKFYDKTFPVSSYIEECMIEKGSGHAED